jgi:uncharacterized Zn finger protein
MKHILITNDDGYESEGLKALIEALDGLAAVMVVAPSTEKSACGHSLTLSHPLSFICVDDDFYKLDDGTLGWLEKAPFDRILVTAGGPEIPEPLVDQLSDPGIMLIPVGQNKRNQILVRVIKENGQIKKENTGAVKFVELVGRHGW